MSEDVKTYVDQCAKAINQMPMDAKTRECTNYLLAQIAMGLAVLSDTLIDVANNRIRYENSKKTQEILRGQKDV